MSGSPEIEYLPTVFENASENWVISQIPLIPNLSKAQKLHALQASVEFAFTALKAWSYTGILGFTADKMQLICQLVQAF